MVSEIARAINGYKVIVEKSTVPVYTNEWIRRVLHRHGVDPQHFDVVSNPEFLREGTAVTDFLHPDRIVVGADSERSAKLLRRIYEPLTAGSYYAQPGALAGSLQRRPSGPAAGHLRAERGDHQARLQCFPGAENLLHQRRGQPGRGRGRRHRGHRRRHGLDSRIGPKFLRAGLGYGGSCFPKDVAAFHWVAQQRGVDFQLLEEVRKINETQKESSSTRCSRRCGRCAASGWPRWAWPSRAIPTTFASLRPSISIRKLLEAGAMVTAYDPAAMERAKEVLPPSENLRYAGDLYEAAKDADAVLILTDWKEFAAIDLARLNQAVRFPIVIDGRNLYKPQDMHDHGFTYVSVGRPASYHAQQVNRASACLKRRSDICQTIFARPSAGFRPCLPICDPGSPFRGFAAKLFSKLRSISL